MNSFYFLNFFNIFTPMFFNQKEFFFLILLIIEVISYAILGKMVNYKYKVKMSAKKGKLEPFVPFKLFDMSTIAQIESKTGRRYYRIINRIAWVFYFIIFTTLILLLKYWVSLQE